MTVIHRRGGNLPLTKKPAVEHDEPDDKKARKPTTIPMVGGIIVAVVFVMICVVLVLPADSGRTTLRPPVHRITERSLESSHRQDQRIGQEEQRDAKPQDDKVEETLARNLESTDVEYHMIFSTGCTTFQDWQSYTFFYHAMKAGQPGHVTRIASGCKPEEAEELQRLHKERIEIMSDHFHLHLTPDYMGVKPGFRYKFFNKPYGVRHWMEHGPLGYPEKTVHDDAIVILLDPDQILLRPLTNNFTDSAVDWKPTKAKDTPKLIVEHGSPFAQWYGYGAQWKTHVNVTHIAGPNSPIEDNDIDQAQDYYPVGPPYMATARDMYNIVVKWSEFVLPVHDDYPHLLAEMFAYSLAAAHLRLPHQIAKSFMVSDPITDLEGWSSIDAVPIEDVCYNVPRKTLPHVLHYCHRYTLRKWLIGKYRMREDFISCESPLLMEPPSDIAVSCNYSIAPNEKGREKPHVCRRQAFMLCNIISGLNQAAEFFKKHNCEVGAVNVEKSYSFSS